MNLGFIGAGNMASAIIKGIINANYMDAKNINVYDVDTNKLKELNADLKINIMENNEELIAQSDIIILAIKPNMFDKVLKDLKNNFKNKTVVSIAAGLQLEDLENILSKDDAIIRVMPNVNVSINKGVSAITSNENVKQEDINIVMDIFNSVGKAYQMDEKDFRAFTGIAGCSPAYAYLFIDSLARAATKNGIPKDLATEIAAHAVLGSAQKIIESDENPWGLIDQVCSPGGTTIAGLLKLEEEGFMNAIVQCIDETIKKDKELS